MSIRCRRSRRTGSSKRAMRLAEAKPLVDRFFRWVDKPLTAALAYARERRDGLEVYLNDPDVAIDTNHLERALRAIPGLRRN
jgi:transposase